MTTQRRDTIGRVAALTTAATCLGALLCIFTIPAWAQVRIVQTACEPSGSDYVTQFAVASANATSGPVCQINVIPLTAVCFPLACDPPPTWTCFPGDVTTFMRASDAGACIDPGETLAGFQFRITEPVCCLMFAYFGSDGTPLGQEEYCFDCTGVGVEPRTWGHAKRLYE